MKEAHGRKLSYLGCHVFAMIVDELVSIPDRQRIGFIVKERLADEVTSDVAVHDFVRDKWYLILSIQIAFFMYNSCHFQVYHVLTTLSPSDAAFPTDVAE